MKKKFRPKFDQFGNRVEYIDNEEKRIISEIKNKHLYKIEEIKRSNKCFGDKVRDIVKYGITNNIIYARKLLE